MRMIRRQPSKVDELYQWYQEQTLFGKICIGTVMTLCSLMILIFVMEDLHHLEVASQLVHCAGIFALIYKLRIKKSCAGLSLKSQELTAMYLTSKFVKGIAGGHISTIIAAVKLVSTLWVICMMRFKLKNTYLKEHDDNKPLSYYVLGCAIVAGIVYPRSLHGFLIKRFLTSFCLCLSAVAMVPQLLLMLKINVVETYTSHYVFALGVARFLGFADWIVVLYETEGSYLGYLASAIQGDTWVILMLLAELLQIFTLSHFCYLYIKSVIAGERIMKLRVPV